MWGTAGNLSMKIRSKPLEIAITPSGVNKGHLTVHDLVTVKDSPAASRVAPGKSAMPSAETLIHQAIYRAAPGAGAVFHVHPIYATLISSFYGHPREKRTLRVEWFEMMKGVGVAEEENAEVAILPNWQDISLIARDVAAYVSTSAKALPVVLIYNHGLTGWGTTPDQARNHLEIMEYVCQYLYLKQLAKH
jgi:methylthioribulose-1-phosphate dehydratase